MKVDAMIKGFSGLFLALLLLGAFASASSHSIAQQDAIRLIPVQDTERETKRGEPDPYLLSLMKQVRDKVDGWLKSVNEQIEREDITRSKVRFLEILRSFLEWAKEKLDAKIESEEGKSKEREIIPSPI